MRSRGQERAATRAQHGSARRHPRRRLALAAHQQCRQRPQCCAQPGLQHRPGLPPRRRPSAAGAVGGPWWWPLPAWRQRLPHQTAPRRSGKRQTEAGGWRVGRWWAGVALAPGSSRTGSSRSLPPLTWAAMVPSAVMPAQSTSQRECGTLEMASPTTPGRWSSTFWPAAPTMATAPLALPASCCEAVPRDSCSETAPL